MSVPTAPQITVRPVATSGALQFFWAAPVSDGGSAITGYTLSCAGETPQSLGASTYEYTYTGLTDGTSYTFSITAENTNGSSPAATFRTVQPGNKPGPVQNLTVTRTDATTATLNWTAPASDGGAALNGYFVKAQSTDAEEAAITRSVPAGETSIILKGLTSGGVYTYTVQAVNDPGYSDAVSTGLFSLASTWNLVPTSATPEGNYWLGIGADVSGTKVVASGFITSSPPFRSIDGGITWADKLASISSALQGALQYRSFACSDDGRVIYIASAQGYIYVSTNYGASFGSSLYVASNQFNSIACSSDGSIAITARTNGTAGSIYVTTNTGANWVAQATPGTRLWNSVCCSKDGQTMIAVGTNFAGWRSINGGTSWAQLTLQPSRPYNWVTCSYDGTKVIACSSTSLISRSVDSGTNWTDILNLGGNIPTGSNILIVASSADGTTLVASTLYAVYISRDSGSTWTRSLVYWSRNSLVSNLGFNKIFCSADGSVTYVLQYSGSIWKTENYGATWIELTNSPRFGSFYTFACSADGTKQYGAELNAQTSYIWRSTDSGTTWNRNIDNTAKKIWRWLCCSADGSFVAATESTGNAGWIWTSSDSGATWTQQTYIADGKNWRGIACDISGAQLIAAEVTTGYLWRSTDSGVTWTALTTAGQRNWRAVASSADGTKLIASVTTSGYIYTSADSGTTWTENTSAGLRDWNSVAMSADGTYLLAGTATGSLLYRSTNGGASWSATSAPAIGFYLGLTMTPDASKMVAVSSYDAVYISTDYGDTWVKQNETEQQQNYSACISSDGSVITTAGYGTSGPYVYKLWG